MALISMKVAPALIAGCTVVLKTSPEAPGEGYLISEAAETVGLPPGVLNVVCADRKVSELLVRDPRVDKITFTGSTAAGRRIASICGMRIARVTLELGGKSAAVILDDADIETTAQALPAAECLVSGQVCASLTRIVVTRSRHDAMVEALAQQRDYVAGLLEQAKAAGAEVQTYGEYAGDWTSGNYMLPSLVLDPAPELGIVAEEQFGPSLPVIPYDDEAQAIRLANATWSGLCSSVWSGDTEHGMAVARQLRTGVTFFNNHNATAVDERAPFGGFNQSGLGRELGREGLLSFTETHVMAVPDGSSAAH